MTAIHIQGLGTYVPTKRITNVDLMSLVDTNDEWIVSRTGIKARHMLADDENGSDAGTEAALKALEDAGIAAEDITHVLTATCTPDYLCPSTACIISGKIGSHGAMAFDLNAACTGFVYGLDVANSILAGKPGAKVLLVGSEAFTRRLNWEDRTTCILFGDGAAAAVYRATEDDNLGIQSTFIAADGSGAEYLRMEALPVEDPFAEDRTVDPKARFLKMQGAAVVRFTARAVPQAIDTALQRAGITADDIDWVVPHQANLRILDVIARRYHLPKEKVYVNMDRFGNTSSASVPICLNEMRRNGLLREGQTIVCTGFGGGLTYGAFVLKL
mgnify:CR=1 FL=1